MVVRCEVYESARDEMVESIPTLVAHLKTLWLRRRWRECGFRIADCELGRALDCAFRLDPQLAIRNRIRCLTAAPLRTLDPEIHAAIAPSSARARATSS
jgi:hypothetical protein